MEFFVIGCIEEQIVWQASIIKAYDPLNGLAASLLLLLKPRVSMSTKVSDAGGAILGLGHLLEVLGVSKL